MLFSVLVCEFPFMFYGCILLFDLFYSSLVLLSSRTTSHHADQYGFCFEQDGLLHPDELADLFSNAPERYFNTSIYCFISLLYFQCISFPICYCGAVHKRTLLL